MKMKALQLETIGALKLKQIPKPVPGHGETLLKVTHCAVCRTDAKMWKSGHRDLTLPRVLGHEICGISEDNGRRFILWPGKSCRICELCRSGAENLCREMRITGFHNDGGFAEYVAASESSLIPLPDDLPGDIAVLAEPLACSINALHQGGVRSGYNVLIYGAGPVGLLMGMAVRAQNANPFIREISDSKLDRSEAFRSEISIRIPEISGNHDFDVVINAAPSSDTFSEGLSELRTGGCFCLFSGLTDEQPIPVSRINDIHYRQLQVTGAYGCTADQMKEALEILSDYKDVKLPIEAHIRLEEVSDVLPKILSGKVLKFVVILD